MIKNYTQVSYEVRIKSSKLPLFQSLSLVKKSLMLFGKTCLIYSRKINPLSGKLWNKEKKNLSVVVLE